MPLKQRNKPYLFFLLLTIYLLPNFLAQYT